MPSSPIEWTPGSCGDMLQDVRWRMVGLVHGHPMDPNPPDNPPGARELLRRLAKHHTACGDHNPSTHHLPCDEGRAITAECELHLR